MGVRIHVARCGRCGKPRGLTHTCLSQRNRPAAIKIKPKVTMTCRTCGKPCGNPLTHTCVIRTDFRQRKAAQARRQAAERKRAGRQAAAERKRQRDIERRRKARAAKLAAAARKRQAVAERKCKASAAAAERRKAAAALRKGTAVPAARPRGGQHDFRACADAHCERFACLVWKEAFREGYDNGYGKGYEVGYDAGFTAGSAGSPGERA